MTCDAKRDKAQPRGDGQKLLFVPIVLLLLTGSVSAQTDQGAVSFGSVITPDSAADDPAPMLAGQSPSSYQLPTPEERFHRYLWDAFGPVAVLRASFGAGWSQASGRPSEWGGGADAYGRRLASHYGELVIQETTRFSLAAAFHEDTQYHRCGCAGVLPRIGHALLSTVTARTRDGGRRISIANVTAPFAGSAGAMAGWYPEPFGLRDAFRFGGLAFAGVAGTNILREFLPIK